MKQILEYVDNLVFSQSNKHLDDLQLSIIKGSIEGLSYKAIADKTLHSESRVRDVGYKLWRILSENLEEDINKLNFSSTIERLQLTSSKIINQDNIKHCHHCPCPYRNMNKNTNNIKIQNLHYSNLKQAPQNVCYGRKNELLIMSQWLEKSDNTVIFVLGNAGIGKSTLVKSFIDLNDLPLDIVIWKDLSFYDSLESLITEILTDTENYHDSCSRNNNIFDQLLNLLTEKKCLLILDNLEEIFLPEKSTGPYKPEYKGYYNFLRTITEVKHQSHLILISQETSTEIQYFEQRSSATKCLKLSGLKDTQILENFQLSNKKFFDDLINLYEGNPLYLQSIAILIKDIFGGDVGKFLAENSLVITENMEFHFAQLFNRLSPIEKQIVLVLSTSIQPCSKEQLGEKLNLPSIELMKGLYSLQRRYLVNTIPGDQIVFKLSAVLQEYLKSIT